ncbi:hypothetical protein KY385_03725 [Candidatus Parcubacteria bacterium]|nr:hypothetical protein [Candidatus Parcubacteria bacterium]
MNPKGKDTIYIDVDEEITGIVDRIQNSPKKIVALVLPKRANSMQSIVNMKLLKRTADQTDKQVVLITSEPRLLPLAGIAKLHVAPNLTSKPYLPDEPQGISSDNSSVIDEGEIDPNTPVSALAPDAKFADDQSPIEIDNTPKAGAAPAAKPAAAKGNKFKIPNFTKFRKKIIIGALAVLLLIFGLIYALVIAPKANVVVKAQTSNVPLSLPFIADTTATELNKEKKVVQALRKEAQKNDSEKVEASGEENKGKKASGSVTMSVSEKCDNPLDAPASVPAGTGVSANGQTYITQNNTTFVLSGGQGNCADYKATNPTPITAQSPGEKFNISGSSSFKVAGRSDVSASGSASGGTDKKVKVVSQTDIDKARERLNSKQNTVQEELKTEFGREGYVAITETFEGSDADYTPSAKVGAEASEVTVSVDVKYSMLGVNEQDLKELIKEEVNKQAEHGAQTVLNDGLAEAVFGPSTAGNGLSDSQTAFNLKTKVITGPDINHDEIKQQITGKKKGEAEELLKKRVGITDPSVELSPFWVSKIPKSSKISVDVQQADGSDIPGN